MAWSGSLRKDVLMLAISYDQHSLADAFTYYEFESVIGGIDRDERNRAIVIFPRCHLAFPLAEIEDGYTVLVQHGELTKFLTEIPLRQTSHQHRCSRYHKSFPVFGKGRFMACCLGCNIAGCLEFAVEDDF